MVIKHLLNGVILQVGKYSHPIRHVGKDLQSREKLDALQSLCEKDWGSSSVVMG